MVYTSTTAWYPSRKSSWEYHNSSVQIAVSSPRGCELHICCSWIENGHGTSSRNPADEPMYGSTPCFWLIAGNCKKIHATYTKTSFRGFVCDNLVVLEHKYPIDTGTTAIVTSIADCNSILVNLFNYAVHH